MRTRFWFWFIFLVGGCQGGGLPGDRTDGGFDNDGSVSADLRGQSCGDVADAVAAWLAAHRLCQVDGDCTVVSTACGLPGDCGAFANTGAPGAYLSSLLSAWNNDHCSGTGCACPQLWPAPGCNNGVCGPRQWHPGAVGDACAGDSDCSPSLRCVTEQASGGVFRGGYCTIPGCDRLNVGCPTGSGCKPVGAVWFCLKECGPVQGEPQCRLDGYGCCGGPGPQGNVAWCAPQNSPLCQAK